MPDFWAHRICASLTLDQLRGTTAAQIIQRNQGSYRLGSQGADLLYFRPIQLCMGRRGIVHLAKLLHKVPVEQLASMSLWFLQKCDEDQFESLFAYTCGFLCHHAVDQQVHPMIAELTDSTLRHRRIELDLDAFMARKLDRGPDIKLRPWAGMYVSELGALTEWYNNLFHELYDRTVKLNACDKAYKMMRRASGLIHKPRRLVKTRHNERAVLTEGELLEMTQRAMAGAAHGAQLVRWLQLQLDNAPTAQPQTAPLRLAGSTAAI